MTDDILRGVARDAALNLSDRGLDQLIASTEAVRRDQWARPELRTAAEANQTMIEELCDIRDERRRLADAVDDALYPSTDDPDAG